MNLHSLIESKHSEQTADFAASRVFHSLESGAVRPADYDDFIAGVCRTHLKSPQIVAFLYSVAPPVSAGDLKHNMLEELGLDEEGVAHPDLLIGLASAAGFDEQKRAGLVREAQETLRRMVSDPILFGTLKEVGLCVLLETISFEWMLSRLADRMAGFLAEFRGLPQDSLRWFHHHSEVDIRHAEEGIRAVIDYIGFYEFDLADAGIVLDLTFRENVFIKRYFGEIALARQTGALS